MDEILEQLRIINEKLDGIVKADNRTKEQLIDDYYKATKYKQYRIAALISKQLRTDFDYDIREHN